MSNTLRQLCLRAHINRVATSGETFCDTQIKRLPCVMRESKSGITGFWITTIVECCLESDTAWNTHRFRPTALHSCRWIGSLNQNQIMHRNTLNTADNEPGLRTNICILPVYLDQLFSSLYAVLLFKVRTMWRSIARPRSSLARTFTAGGVTSRVLPRCCGTRCLGSPLFWHLKCFGLLVTLLLPP